MQSLLRALLLSALSGLSFTLLLSDARGQAPAAQAPKPQLGEELGLAPDTIRQALLAGRYADAIEELESLAGQNTENLDQWLFLSGIAHAGAGDSARAQAQFERVETEFPKSPWVTKALFRRAEQIYASGNFEETARIWEEASKRLRSAKRQGELASVYLDLAARFERENADDPSEEGRARLDQAYELYARVLDLAAPQELRELALFSMAETRFAQKRWSEAATDYTSYLQAESALEPADAGVPRMLEREIRSEGRNSQAKLRRAVARSRSGNQALARLELEDLSAELKQLIDHAGRLEEGPENPFRDAGETEEWIEEQQELRLEALRALPKTFSQATAADHLLAAAAWRRYLEATVALGDDLDAASARYELGLRLRHAGRAQEAAKEWRQVIEDLSGNSGAADRSEWDRVRAQTLFASAGLLRSQNRFAEARTLFEQYTREHPSGASWSEAQKRIIECEADRADSLSTAGDFVAAREAWGEFLRNHPLDSRAPSVLLSIGALHDQEARKLKEGGAENESAVRASFERAIEGWKELIARYPNTYESARAAFRIGLIHEEEWGDLRTAIESYRSPEGRNSSDARQRLSAMLETYLQATGERTRRSGEKTELLVTTRNVKQLEVELYNLDLEAYFQKHATHEGVQQLDLDLIAPDHRFDHEIENYKRYSLHETRLELPTEGPGTWVAVVRGEDLFATTLVRRSDLELIVHATAEEALVWVENVEAAEPAHGVRVLLSLRYPDGTRDWIEGVTDEVGVARVPLGEKKRAGKIGVLAKHEGHTASSGLNLNSTVASQGLAGRGVILTDRPVYRPGETISWRVIARAAENGEFVTPAGEEGRLTLRDARGRRIETRPITLGEFGTATGEFVLPSSQSFGEWKISTTIAGLIFSKKIQVANFELRKTELLADVERDVVFRGEEVVCHFTAQQYWGTPAQDMPLRVNLPDGRTIDGTTDENGKFTVRFDTRDFASARTLRIQGVLGSEGIFAEARVQLAVLGYRLQVSTPRPVALLGETVPVRVKALSALDGKPVQEELELVVMRTVPGSSSGSVEVSRTPFVTDAETGEATLPLAPEVEGNHFLRIEGMDRFGHPVQTSATLYVSGENDPQALRLLTDDLELQPGGNSEVQIVHRGDPGLALVTFETDRIADLRVVRLSRGVNRLAFDCQSAWVPGFRLRVATRGESRLHQATAEFSVERQLRLTWSLAEDWKPGEETQVELEVRDGLGRPVEAELSLSVVDAALFDEHPDSNKSLRQAFRPGRSVPIYVETGASCTNRHAGVTRTIDDAVLAEERRQKEEQRWDEQRLRVIDQIGAARVSANSTQAGLAELDLDGFAAGFVAEEAEDEISFDAVLGIGGGAGGSMGGRAGGRKSLRAGGGRGIAGGDEQELSTTVSPTALWVGSVVTSADGKASVQLVVPARSARWRLDARGVGRDAHFGEARTERSSQEDFSIELVRIGTLLEGDSPRFVARVFDTRMEAGPCTLRLRFDAEEGKQALPVLEQQVELDGSARSEFVFDATPALGVHEILTVHLEAERENGARATHQRKVEVLPYGIERVDSESGLLTDSRQLRLKLESDGRTTHRRLELEIHSGVPRWLIQTALRQEDLRRTPRHGSMRTARIAADLLGVLELLQDLTGSTADSPEGRLLRDRARALAAHLVSAAKPEDSSNAGRIQPSPSPVAAALKLRALATAKALGLDIEASAISERKKWIAKLNSRIERGNSETQAMLLHALCVAGSPDFATANRLHRERHALSPAALSYLALALVRMERAPMARECALLLEEKAELRGTSLQGCRWPTFDNRSPHRDPLTMTALAVHALQAALPKSPRIEEGVQTLLSQTSWQRSPQAGIALLVLANHYSTLGRTSANFSIRAMLPGGETRTFTFSPNTSLNHQSTTWALADLEAGDEDELLLDLEYAGRGTPYFRATLHGIDPDFASAEETRDPVAAEGLHIHYDRYHFASLYERGKEVPSDPQSRLFRRVNDSKLAPSLTDVPAGERLRIKVSWADSTENDSLFSSDRLELHVPVPAGTHPLLTPLRSQYSEVALDRGMLRVNLPPGVRSGVFEVDVLGVVPGAYRALPAILKSSYNPDRLTYGSARSLAVLEQGQPFRTERVLTPTETHALGLSAHEHGETERAWTLLQPFFAEHQDNLTPGPLRQVATALFDLSLERDDSSAIVDAFEVLKERFPDLVVPVDRVQRAAEAYSALGEHERAFLIHRAIVDETFAKDLKVVGQLERLGRTFESLEMMHRLWLDYPDLPGVVQTMLTLSDSLLLRAKNAAENDSLRRSGFNRARLTRAGILSLRRFLSLYSQDPLAVEAALNLVQAHLDIEDYKTTAALCDEMVDRFDEAPYSDAFLYTRAVANWYLGATDAALDDLQKIAKARYPKAGGGFEPSENRDLALYILAQIHHAMKETDRAEEYYERIEEKFSDAKTALRSFRAEVLELSEVTTSAPGAQASVEITHKNLEEVNLSVYAVDLLTLYLREKDLSRVTEVELSGIAPILSRKVSLAPNREAERLRATVSEVPLQLEEPGAYLVLARSGAHHASGLTLVTNLELLIDEDIPSGSVRVQTLRGEEADFVRGADVRVVGSHDGVLHRGETDPRGLYSTSGVQGTATVIARSGERMYAFHRGDVLLGNVAPAESLQERGKGVLEPAQEVNYFDNVAGFNRLRIEQRGRDLKKIIDKDSAGVQVQSVK